MRSLFTGSLVAALVCAASAGAIPPPINVFMTTDCSDTEFVLRVVADNFSGETVMLTVRRVQDAPGLQGEQLLLDAVELPSAENPTQFLLPDPELGVQDIGYYEAVVTWADGSPYGSWSTQIACTEEPYLMRGWLLDDSTFQPCTGLGLLECDTVTLMYADMLQYVGTWELLEIYGWTEYLADRDDCWVTVTAIESLGVGTMCEEVVATAPVAWGAVKARYR
jgi:hypothetical protein